jgi:DNA-binding LacI/PurR family transcriptional regulator/anti-anti-sigma regulatory factor
MTHPQPTGTIGFVTPFVSGIYFGSVLAGAEQAARRHGLRLLVFQESLAELSRVSLARDRVDGWVVVLNTEGIEQFAHSGAPVVTVSTPVPNLPSVVSDNFGGTHTAVLHLIDHGHQRIAFAGRRENLDIGQRFAGYCAALAERGIALDERLVVDTIDELEPSGRMAVRSLLEAGLPFTALVAGTDKNALGVLEELLAAGRRVPEDVALVGFDDVAQAQTAEPPLTTVRQRFDTLGITAVDLLAARLTGRDVLAAPTNVPTTLIARRSCGCTDDQPLYEQLAADVAATDDWRDRLAPALVQLLLHPVTPDPDVAPAQVWPGMTVLVDTIEAAIQGRGLPSGAAIEQAWHAAMALTIDLDALNTTLGLLEQMGKRLLAAAQDVAAPARLERTLRLIRKELIRARIGYEAVQVRYLDNVVRANNEISGAVLSGTEASVPSLDWLRHTPALWACLCLWFDPTEQSELTVVSTYTRDGRSLWAVGERFTAATFPPDAAARDAAVGITLLLPIRTAARAWGVLALNGSFDTRFAWNSDPIIMWAEMISAALDRAALTRELREQQTTLQAAYQRQSVLADTVREIGSPVIPIMPGVLLIPLIGALDSARAQQIIAAALEGVRHERATDVLIDVTGVPIIDTQIAGALIRLARMTGLLGARTTLVGVRPEIAQSIVGLGIDLLDLRTAPTLAAAISMLQSSRRTSAL